MVNVYFKNIEDVIVTQIKDANNQISVAVAWFTNQLIFDSLVDALKRNVAVKILILNDVLNRNEFGLDFGVLSKLGAEVRFAKSSKGTMHNKFCIIDDMVITGSFNWTYHAKNNSENILMTDDEIVVNSYREEFERLFNDAKPISQPYERIKWTEVKEGDFSELRRNIFRDVIAKNDENRELKRIKLINLDHAYKSGDAKELVNASLLPIQGKLKSITDVLTSKSRDYEFRLWEENILGKPYNDVDGYIRLEKWFFIPFAIKEDQYHQAYVEGVLKTYDSLDYPLAKGLKLKVHDYEFVNVIRKFWGEKTYDDYELIPKDILTIENAKLFYFQFPSPMFNKSQPRTWKNTMPRTISAINLLGIVNVIDGDNVVFYEGWDPQKRGEKIMKQYFVKEL